MRRVARVVVTVACVASCGGVPPPPRGEPIGPYQIHCYPTPEAAREALCPLAAEPTCDYDREHDCWTCEL